jgi:2-methylisocitrate lyase-like PEP mutase family enzyme
MGMTDRLRRFLDADDVCVAPGVFDALSARLVERAGFPAVYASGGAIARSAGVPDLGLLSVTEVVTRLESVVEAVSVPVIADADTGYGSALNVYRTVKQFRRAGVAALHLEDQLFPKRCGHYDDKKIVSPEEMEQRLHAARDAIGSDLLLIARTDGIAVEGFERTIERAHRYARAGADVLFVEAPASEEQIAAIARELPYPKLINMFFGGKTPLVPVPALKQLGYRFVIIPSDLQRAALWAMERTLEAIRKDGSSLGRADQMYSFRDREQLVSTASYLELERRYATE